MTSPTNLFRNLFTAAIMHHSCSCQLAKKSSTWHNPARLLYSVETNILCCFYVQLWNNCFSGSQTYPKWAVMSLATSFGHCNSCTFNCLQLASELDWIHLYSCFVITGWYNLPPCSESKWNPIESLCREELIFIVAVLRLCGNVSYDVWHFVPILGKLFVELDFI